MQIKIDVKILIFLLIFYITKQLNTYVLLMIFAFFHELSHLMVGVILGFSPQILEVKPIGFSLSFRNPIKDYNKKIMKGNALELKKILIYMAGPLFNLFMSVLLYKIHFEIEYVYVNIILFLINLVPIYPLDGGRILKSLTYLFVGLRKSYMIVEKISYISILIMLFISSLAVLKVHNFGILILVFYLVYIKYKESKVINRRMKLFKIIDEI